MFEFIGNQGVIVDFKFEKWMLAIKAGIKENLTIFRINVGVTEK